MKTLTKILTVVALVVLCVCLFTVSAYADNPKITEIIAANAGDCFTQQRAAGFKLSNGSIYQGTAPGAVGDEVTAGDLTGCTLLSSADELLMGYKHNMDNTLVKNPASTCSVNGKEYYVCQDCGKHFKDAAGTQEGESVSALADHEGVSPHVDEKAAKCGEDGNIEYTYCKNCGALLDKNNKEISSYKIPATGAHTWTDWLILKEPTNVSPGNQKRTCTGCGKVEYEEIPALGITDGEDINYVIAIRDTWLRGEEPLTFESPLVKKLNDQSGSSANYVGVRIGTDSLYENSYDTFDFWSWDKYVKLGDKTIGALREGTYRLWIYDKNHPEVYTDSCVFYVLDVPTLEPYSTDKHVVNSSKSLRFIASEEINPDSVWVGSRKLYDAADYFVSNDRKNITLSADFLNARQTGTYTISAQTKDGRTIKTNFYILTTAQASSSPRTGDESQIGLWAAFLLLSGAAVVVLVPKLRKSGVK